MNTPHHNNTLITRLNKMPYDIIRYTNAFIPYDICKYCKSEIVFFPPSYPPLIVCNKTLCNSQCIAFHSFLLVKITTYPFYVFIRPIFFITIYLLFFLFYIIHFAVVTFILAIYYSLYLSISTILHIYTGFTFPLFPAIIPIMPFLEPPSEYISPFIISAFRHFNS